MIIRRYNQTFFQANTYIIIPRPCPNSSESSVASQPDQGVTSAESDCQKKESLALVVDPGAGCAQWVDSQLKELHASVGAVLLTHGHADHVWDCSAVSGDAPVYVPSPDMYRMDDPIATLGMPQVALGFTRMGAHSEWERPRNLRALPYAMYSTMVPIIPGLALRAVATPGHTEGSSVFLFAACVEDAFHQELVHEREHTYMLSGDVIFAGSVGRTDLPGGDQREMEASLRFLVNVIKPDVYILPGHGPHTTMWDETRNNPYIHSAMS